MKRNLPAILSLIALIFVILFLTLHPVLKQPNSFLFSDGNESINNYFNISWFIKHDKGFIFNGDNYPYGNHVQNTNNQPLLYNTCRLTDKISPISDFGVAIFNLSLLLSLLLAAPFIFLILRHYKLPIWYSIVISLIVIFLSPQLAYISQSPTMAYIAFIPMFWYLLIRYQKSDKSWLWGSLLILSGFIGGFTNKYYVGFYSSFLFTMIISELIIQWGNLKQYYRKLLILFGVALIPITVIAIINHFTTQSNTYDNNSWSFLTHHASPFSIFMPNAPELRNLIQNLINLNYSFEGRAYVGLPATLLALSMIFAFFHNLVTKKKNISLYIDNEMNGFLLAAFLVLLFSMCFPFKIIGWPVKIQLKFLLDWLPQIGRISYPGRFSWIFYYVFTIYTAIFFYNLYIKMKAKGFVKFPVLFLSFVIMFWTIDAAINAKKSFPKQLITNSIFNKPNENEKELIQQYQLDTSYFQAIFAMPFSYATSNNSVSDTTSIHLLKQAMKWSYNTGIPLVQSAETQTPTEQKLSSIQLLSESSIKKSRLDDMNDKPLLIMYLKNKLNQSEEQLLKHAKHLFIYNNTNFALLDVNTLKESHKNWLDYSEQTISILKGNDSIKADVALRRIMYLSFDTESSKNTFAGKGALYEKKKTATIFDENLSELGIQGNYNLSFWVQTTSKRQTTYKIQLVEQHTNNEQSDTIQLNTLQAYNYYNLWQQVQHNIHIKPNYKYRLDVMGQHICIDEVLLKPQKSNVWIKKDDDTELFNNFIR
ncbi:MAG: hypothetical protein JW735_01455 [Prolixibacteraceae bacterium]|nr:hypothetical protein [Prolixibacteraceae bacterium]